MRTSGALLLVACAAAPRPIVAEPAPAAGHTYYVAVDGAAENPGTAAAPWALAPALVDKRVQPGDRIVVRGGRYVVPDRTSLGFHLGLVGAPDQRIVVRAVPGERVTLDGGLTDQGERCAHVVVEGFEITVGENAHDHPTSKQPGSSPTDLGRPAGGISIFTCEDLAIVDNAVHDNSGVGISFWSAASGEIAGNLIYANGWLGPDRHHGHGIYVQNGGRAWKRIRGNLVFDNFDVNIHAYGSKKAKVERLEIANNLVLGGPHSADGRLLVGGPTLHEIRIARNFLAGASLQLGYGDAGGDTSEVTDNTIVSGELDTTHGVAATVKGNAIAKLGARVIPDAYDPDRALVAIAGAGKTARIALPFHAGDPIAIRRADDPYGAPVLRARYDGRAIEVPRYGELTALVATRE